MVIFTKEKKTEECVQILLRKRKIKMISSEPHRTIANNRLSPQSCIFITAGSAAVAQC